VLGWGAQPTRVAKAPLFFRFVSSFPNHSRQARVYPLRLDNALSILYIQFVLKETL